MLVVSANLGWGGPQARPALERLEQWIARLAEDGVGVLLLQEMPQALEWRDGLASAGYRLHEGGPPVYRCRSGVAVHESVGEMHPVPLETSTYHGSYVAAAEVGPGASSPILFVSVHASPTALKPADLGRWRWAPPRQRRGTAADPPLWDSDFVLSTLHTLVQSHRSVLVGGDLNEARAWDQHRGGHWGEDWFRFAEEIGLFDITFGSWGEERPTHGRYQDDHLLGTADVVALVTDASIGPSPESDHASLLVSLALERG